MAVLPMKRVTLYGIKSERKAVLEELQRRGVIDVKDIQFSEYGFSKLDTAAPRATFSKAISVASEALSSLDKYVPEKSPMFAALHGRKQISVEDYYKFVEDTGEIMTTASKVNAIVKEINEINSEMVHREQQIIALKPWYNLNVPLSFSGTKTTTAFIGKFSEKRIVQDILTEYYNVGDGAHNDAPPIDIQIISESDEQTCVFILSHKSDETVVDERLKRMDFQKPIIMTTVVPSEQIEKYEKEMDESVRRIKELENEIKTYDGFRNSFKFIVDYYAMRIEKYEVLMKLGQNKNVFVLAGYVPSRDVESLSNLMMSKYSLAIESEDPDSDEDVPVLLSNNKFAAPVEGVLETYSMPSRGEADPTSVMAFFYYILFGLMLSDAAYGAIMILVCGLVLKKFKNIESGMKKTMQMFLYCGISTLFWGIMFGGYFGDAVTVISETFLGVSVTIPPLWFAPIDDPMKMLIFSFAIGIVHIFAGLGMKLYQCVKTGDMKSAVYDVVFWYLIVGGGVVYLLSMQMFVDMAGLNFKLPPAVGTIAAVCAGIGALGIVAFGGRSSNNPFKRAAKGLYELYGVTSYLSDILSYSRLLALGLATGVIASVFNKMGSMFGGGVLGFVLFLIVFVIGHTLNIGINLLGAYVHTNRLQFVEFFGKFYEGGGKKYAPYSVNTKYYKFKEDM